MFDHCSNSDHFTQRRLFSPVGLQVSAETTEDCTNLNMSHNESPSGSQVSHSTSQDNDATEPEECARTRPWTHNNPLLRQLPWPDDEDMDYTPPHSAAADSQTADVDITTPEVADIASRMDMRNPAAQALHKDQQGRGSSLTTLAPHATDAVLPHHSTVQRQQVNAVHFCTAMVLFTACKLLSMHVQAQLQVVS